MTPPILGRPPERTQRLVRELRGRITRGDLEPGMQLPTRIEIEQDFAVSSVTVQRALEELQRDGFVTVNGRQGTYVSQTPPHLTNYALVFPTLPDKTGWNRFFEVLNEEAFALAQGMNRQISAYYNADKNLTHPDYKRLLDDVEAHRLSGIIFASLPVLLTETPVVDAPHIPRVAITRPSPDFAMPAVCLDRQTLWQRSAELLLERGRRDLALLLPPLGDLEIEKIRLTMLNFGFNVPPHWVQITTGYPALAARNLTHLLFQKSGPRPNAFFITDDNLVEHALEGLLAAGVQVPDEVEIVAHCNFPHPVPSSLPVHRLGFDARRVLLACFDDLDTQRAGQQAPQITTIPAQFEAEIASQCVSSK